MSGELEPKTDSAVRPHLIAICKQLLDDDDSWPGTALARFLYESIGEKFFTGPPEPIAGGMLLTVPMNHCDMQIACHHFFELENGLSCHVRTRRRLEHWRHFFSTPKPRQCAARLCGSIEYFLDERGDVEILGWMTDQEYRSHQF